MDPKNSNVIAFKMDDFKSRLSHQLALQLSMKFIGKKVHHTVLDEGSSIFVMYLSLWRSISSPEINHSTTTLKAFDGRCFQPHGLLPSLMVEIGGKPVSIHVKFVNAPLDYNLLLGINWHYMMQPVASSIFRVVQFPFQGNIVTID